ncbi:MAG: rhamnan synthesis F family protein [Acidithiobacillus sp.]|nr:rhamnan synthesis F family protein [Acidithiobacillus sp.]
MGKISELQYDLEILSNGKHQGVGTAVLLHLYYPDLWPEFQTFLKALPPPCDVYISLSEGREDVLADIVRDMPEAVVIRHPNRGRDIAPRLALLRMARQRSYSQLLFLHTKKSPHLRDVENIHIPFLQHKDGNRWRRELLAELLETAPRALKAFAQQPKLGLVGPRGFWLHLHNDGNLPQIASLSQRFGLAPDLSRHGYFAGSMFWCRPEALDPLLALDLKFTDFEEEAGQVDGTLAHAIERLFTLSAEGAGFEVRDSAGALMVEPVRQISPWLPEARWLPMERRWAEEVSEAEKASSAQSPRITLSVLLHPSRSAAATTASIKAQWARAELLELPPASENWLAGLNERLLASGCEWIALLDAGDELAPDAIFRIQQSITTHPEWQLIYTDEDSLTADGQHVNPHCKPDFNIDYLRSLPYVGGLLVIKKELFEALGGFHPAADGAEDYDLVLRAWERTGDAGIGHIPAVLYHRLQGGGHCSQSIEEILAASKAALERHLQRLQIAAEVLPGPFPPSTRVRYPLTATPTVSIIIPTRNQLGILQRCVESIIEKTRYPHYEILLVDNDSDDEETRNYLQLLEAQEESLGGRLRVLRHPGAFNFSAMNNRAVEQARGDYLLLLNNDTAALHEDWLDEMVSQALRPEVGIVGAKLLFPDSKIQHAGVILGMKGPAEHSFIGQPAEYRGYYGRAMLTQDLSAVTGACLLIAKELYQQVGALDEEKFQVSYNDIDLCLKVRESGKKIVFTPWAILLHEGSASQRGEVEKKPSPEKEKRFASEKMAFYRKWLPQIAADPAFNRQLSLASTDFLIESEAALTWDPDWRPRPRILVHPADREGCGEYRIIAPMRALNRAGRTQGWETMRIFEPAEMERMQPDSIVLQRQMEWPQIEALERHKALSGAFRVFEIDDLITNLPVKSLHKAHIHKDIAKRFRKAAGLCNRLVVATEPLAQAYKGFSDEVRVQSNCIEDAVWGSLQAQRRGNDKPRVGWAGGVGHTGDLEMVADVVRDLAEEVDWIFFGLCPDALKPYVREFHTGVPLPQYPAKLASLDLDLAIAPLEDNPFNEAKSHLRLLEYGILGYPVVCSDVYPYQGDFPVVRVSNRYRDWMKAIREAIADRQALAETGDRLRKQVRAHWLLENRLDDWLAAWLP